MACAVLLGLSSAGLAAEADSPGRTEDANLTASGVHAIPQPVVVADNPHQQAILALHQERQAYVEAFDWNRAGDRQALKGEYAATMDSFELRELELKIDWYEATGQTQLLERTRATLERRTNPARQLPDIAGDRLPSTEVNQQPEVTR
jgi:hypothetical protein